MKSNHFTDALVVFFLLTVASPAMATTNHENLRENTEARVQQLTDRLEVIKSIDKGLLPLAEKKKLRREVREIKKELAVIGGGVYLSVGALLLIALLLILLL
jgi:hypothetical protein